MRIGVIGINHKLANLELREVLAKACQKRFLPGNCFYGGHTFVLLTTCNRTEVYFASDDLAASHSYLLHILRHEVENEFDQKVYSYFGQDCFLHLCRVTAGLDSAIVAETEIQGQVKAAYELAMGSDHLPMELHYLFQKALKVGKQIRSELSLGRGMPDIEHAVCNAGANLFKSAEEARILFVGASDINEKILAFLKNKQFNDITLCNRTAERAHAVAERHQVQTLEWNRISEWQRFNWIIFGTKATNYLIGKQELADKCVGHKLVIDLCVPRNVEPNLGKDPQVTLLNIDQINRILKVRKSNMLDALDKAEAMIDHAARQHVSSFQDKQAYRLKLA